MKMFPIALLFLAGLETAVNESSQLLEGKYDPTLPLLHKTGMVSSRQLSLVHFYLCQLRKLDF